MLWNRMHYLVSIRWNTSMDGLSRRLEWLTTRLPTVWRQHIQKSVDSPSLFREIILPIRMLFHSGRCSSWLPIYTPGFFVRLRSRFQSVISASSRRIHNLSGSWTATKYVFAFHGIRLIQDGCLADFSGSHPSFTGGVFWTALLQSVHIIFPSIHRLGVVGIHINQVSRFLVQGLSILNIKACVHCWNV